jgi:eukaryotic-like serine/threonine-protein kinase
VSHPHLACILASHLTQAPYYVVMPYMAGCTVESAIRRTVILPIPYALWIVRQCAAAASALHRHGWLHGDIKPSNIHVARDGHVTLLDLGLARRAGSADRADHQPLAGTLAYMAPEALGSVVEIGPGSDVYSLGATLYRMLTSRPPFVCDTAAELADAHLQLAPPDPRRFNPRLSAAVVHLILRMLAKQPAQRPAIDALIRESVALEIATFDQRTVA